MKFTYDEFTDILTLVLKRDTAAVISEIRNGRVILDFDAGGDLVAVEILNALSRVTELPSIEFESIPVVRTIS